MSLREWLGMPEKDRRHELFERYGIVDNPFPPVSQTRSHPHMKTPADNEIVTRLKSFIANKTTQILVVEGTQGIGKTNLLEFYTHEMMDIREQLPGFVIVKYSADPEPDFGRVVQRVVQEFGCERIQEIGVKLSERRRKDPQLTETLKNIKTPDLRAAFVSLSKYATNRLALSEASTSCFEYLLGQRVLRRHSDQLHVNFRLETTEARTQALQDLIYISVDLGLLTAVFLFMDELEKIGGLQSVLVTTRYLSGIRALIDALPRNLFMLMGMTPDARQRYSEMLPALAGRLQNPVRLYPLKSDDDAVELFRFYLNHARERARLDPDISSFGVLPGEMNPLRESDVRALFARMQSQGSVQTNRPVTQRAFLGSLHNMTESVIAPSNPEA